MKFPKQCVSGKPIDLKKDELGIINQFVVDDFMDDYDINEFIRPFYIEQSMMLYEDIKNLNIPLLTYLSTSLGKNEELINLLFKSLKFLYKASEVKLSEIDGEYIIIIKKDGKGIANINDRNFHLLSDIIFEILYFPYKHTL